MSSMQAIVMTKPGGPEVLEARTLPVPEMPSPRHIRVRLHAAGINPLDTKMRANGTYYPDRLPTVLGCDGAGVVERVGAEVSRFKVGDKVYFFQGGTGGEQGSYAEFNTVHEDYAALMPSNLSFIEAAAVPLVLITAWESLHRRAPVGLGDRVLIHAAAGGVGHVAVQIAQLAGARVAGTVGDAAKADFVRALGVERPIEYKREDFVKAVFDWTGGAGADVILDPIGGETFSKSLTVTRVYGQVVTLVQAPYDAEALKTGRLRNVGIHYEVMLAPQHFALHAARVEQGKILEYGARLIEQGRLKVHVSGELPLREAAEAHRRIGAGSTTGKIVLRIE